MKGARDPVGCTPHTPRYSLAFHKHTPFGHCVGVWLPPAEACLDVVVDGRLTPAEQAQAATMMPRRRVCWMGGRIALREAFARGARTCGDILSSPRGAPHVPPDCTASISHKDRLAVALVDSVERGRVGVDVEDLEPARPDIVRLVLRDGERGLVESVAPEQKWFETVLRFSTKEAIYKALDPYVNRYVAFHEAEVVPQPDGTCAVTLSLVKGEGPFEIDAAWERWTDFVLTYVRVRESTAFVRPQPD
jgi:4'-phosphopantetheinyl transferase EntD